MLIFEQYQALCQDMNYDPLAHLLFGLECICIFDWLIDINQR